MGNTYQRNHQGLKCLSALGFWGAGQVVVTTFKHDGASQMPFGFGVLGSSYNLSCITEQHNRCLKCLSALGFWGAKTC